MAKAIAQQDDLDEGRWYIIMGPREEERSWDEEPQAIPDVAKVIAMQMAGQSVRLEVMDLPFGIFRPAGQLGSTVTLDLRKVGLGKADMRYVKTQANMSPSMTDEQFANYIEEGLNGQRTGANPLQELLAGIRRGK